MSNPDLKSILTAALRSGIAHNNGAGGQYLLCATEAQLCAFAASIAPTEAAATVPAGWKLVPLVATKAMTDAAHQSARLEHEEEGEGCCGWFLDNPEEVYAAMLAAAPKETP